MKNLKGKEPRVLHLISSSGFLGAENVVLELSKEIDRQSLWVAIGILENKNKLHMALADRAKEEGLKVQIFPCRGRFDQRTIVATRDFIDSNKPNILHSHNYKSNFYAWRTLTSKKMPWIITNHGKRAGITLSIYNRLNVFFMKKADKIVAVSQALADEMIQHGISSTRMHIIDNGVNLKRFANQRMDNDLRKSFGLNGTNKIIGTIGSLTEEKGHIYLLKAVRQVIDKYPEFRFLIVGDGNHRQVLEERTADLGLSDQLIFTGSRNDVPEILQMLDAFVLPSLKEGLPMALLEAMASKVPVIATSVGAIPNVIEDGINGLLIPPKNSDAISEAINKMLPNGNSAKEMATKGFEKVRDHYSSKQMADKYLAVYKEMLSQV